MSRPWKRNAVYIDCKYGNILVVSKEQASTPRTSYILISILDARGSNQTNVNKQGSITFGSEKGGM